MNIQKEKTHFENLFKRPYHWPKCAKKMCIGTAFKYEKTACGENSVKKSSPQGESASKNYLIEMA